MRRESDHENPKYIHGGLFCKFKNVLDASDDEFKAIHRNSHEAIDLMEKKVRDEFSTDETRLSTLLDRFHARLGSKPNNDIRHKVNQLALRLSAIDCRSCSIHSIKNRVLASKEYQDNLETLVTSLENSYNSLRTIIMEVDAMERNLIRFSSDWRLSQESVLSDMRSMQHIKEKYLNLSKSLSESDRQLSELLSSVEKAPDQRLLMSWKKEIEEIKERKAILSNRVDQYMGIDIDTTKAEKQLSDALSQMASVDSQLQKIMGFNAWN
ncbi:hypothetical protein MS3_00006488 [Schistosoma haematobium]|uniref:Uncharacterized protein n=2 Tax=Schistosoma TaxID=6181 RepID=A0A430QPY6_SCHBO|nr:hypothetical protein MS3_00006488 [Schistosoma haematobium]KAH9585134.1 hypothetical protein MS3_00006488 [Schistosoma haematobium]RTG89765.1 uncharacterized protein DC041_0009791 [Schistosoma bovis]CAH8513044.1 unnamed protein product [Schistosoma haematobium]CAH8516013.1 unnamed protein product [Schistosoma haematobium]